MDVLNMLRLTMHCSELIIPLCMEKWRLYHVLTLGPYFHNIHKRKTAIV